MSGFEVAEASGASKGVVSAVLSKEVFTFFSTWDLDTSLLDQLETQLNSVEALLCDAEEKLIDKNVYVEEWAQKARFAIYDADDFLDKTLADVPGSNEVRTNIINTIESSEYSTDDKIKSNVKDVVPAIHPCKKIIEEELGEIIEKLQSLAAQKDTFGLKEKSEMSLFTIGRPTFINETFTIYGRSEDKHAIIRMLNSREGNDDAFRVIPIVGKSGIGKTTLACLVFHEYKGLNRSFGLPSWLGRLVQREDNRSSPYVFDVKGWICVSDEFDATHVIKSLLESITGQESKVNCSLKSLQHELKKQLQGKKYLIVLDDFWSNELEDWNVLQTCFSVGVSGSRVIITTRSTEVARTVTTIHDFFYELDKLSRDESWFLFEKTVFRDENSSKQLTLTDIGLDIVSRCNGLPMSIKMIGRLLLLKGNDEIEWRSVLNNKIWENSNIIPSIWLSYYDLPSGVRKCFAYCSVFPKGYLFTMEEVTMLWIGEGLIEKFCEDNRYEDVARAYFTHLCSKLFFQESGNGGSEFVMHDLVRDLALYVSRGLCVNLRNVTVQSRRLSYVQGKEESLLNNMSGENVRHLRTFLPLRGNGFPKIGKGFYFNNELFGNLLSNFKLLRVLSLNGYAISKLPDSVGDMKLLRYLDLSWTNIDYLPSKVCQLYNLRILLMSGCRNLTRLPSEICNLVNLRHLHIDGTNLEEMPDGIGKMTNIRTLSNFVVDGGKSKQKREFKELPNIKGILQDCRDEVMEESAQKCFACGFGCRREVKKCSCKMGTIIVPEIVPPPADDCLRLKKALDGWGADEEELIRVMGRRNANQRKQITEAYQDLYKESLLDRIDSELSGDFKKAVLLWVYDPAERDARLIREALKATKQLVKQLEVLVEVACTTPPTHLSAVRKAYSLLFHCSIEQDIRSNVPSTPLQKLLLELVRSFLHDSGEVDTNLAISEAAELYKCIKARLFESGRFLSILSTRNIFQLRETFECYQRSFKNPIDQDIKSSGRADSEAVFSLMARCIHKPEMHFAEVIRKATIGLGTDEDSITRAIVTRAEVDMVKIKSAYSEMYKSTVESAVAGDTSGYYKAFLMTLLGFSDGTSGVQFRNSKVSVVEDGSVIQSSEVIDESVSLQEIHTICKTLIMPIKDAEIEPVYHSSESVQADGSHHPILDLTISEELGVSDAEPIDYDVEGVLKKQETHDLICPNCCSCITHRVILKTRKRVPKDTHPGAKRERIEIMPIKDAEIETVYHSSKSVQAEGSHHPTLDSTISEELGVIYEGVDYDVEGVLKKQETHDLFCPNCYSCITHRVILRKRKRVPKDTHPSAMRDRIEEDTGTVHGALGKSLTIRGEDTKSCEATKSDIDPATKKKGAINQVEVNTTILQTSEEKNSTETSSLTLEKHRFHSVGTDYLTTHAQLAGKDKKTETGSNLKTQETMASTIMFSPEELQIKIEDNPNTEFDSFKDSKLLQSEDTVSAAVQGAKLLEKLLTDLVKGSNITADDERILRENEVKQRVSCRTELILMDKRILVTGTKADVGEPVVQAGEQVVQVGEARDWDILKSIVYGGLIESITSLGVVASAAGAETATLNIVVLGLANLIGGLILIFHNLKDLRKSVYEGPSNQVDRYHEVLGRRSNFKLHAVIVVLSFLIFGLIPIATYAFTFRKSDNRDYKSLAVIGASLISVTLLSLGKAHTKNPPRAAFKALSYYLTIAISAFGLSYVAGKLLNELIEKTGWFDTTSSSLNSISFPATVMPSQPAWGSY